MPITQAPPGTAPISTRFQLSRFDSLILAVAFLAAAAIISFVTAKRMEQSRALVLHTYQVRGLLKDLRSDIAASHANFDLYQLFKNEAEVPKLEELSREELSILKQLQDLTIDNPVQQARLEKLSGVLHEDLLQLHACLMQQDCVVAGSVAGKAIMAEISGRRASMSNTLRELEGVEDRLLQSRLQNWDHLFIRLIITLVGCFALALLLLFYNFRLLFREIERRKEQELVEKNNAESFKLLSARILELQDVERRKIARELHDSVGQFLAGLKLNLGRLQRRDTDPSAQNFQLLTETIELTDRAIGEVRTISHLLHPPLLDELGFHSAARWYTEGFAKRSGIQVELQLAEVVDRLPREIELALFRALQESLINVHRHANATKVEIELQCTDDEVILFVADDGKGLNRDTLLRFRAGHGGGIGLAGMRERLAELGGSLEVESSAKGTRICATLPTKECDPADPPAENVTISPD